jgi:hypothetical protein
LGRRLRQRQKLGLDQELAFGINSENKLAPTLYGIDFARSVCQLNGYLIFAARQFSGDQEQRWSKEISLSIIGVKKTYVKEFRVSVEIIIDGFIFSQIEGPQQFDRCRPQGIALTQAMSNRWALSTAWHY